MLLELQDLCVTYRTGKKDLKAVDHVSFGIERGDTLGIIGESGSGKSTLVMAMLRQLDPRFAKISGSIHFKGQELTALSNDEFKRLLWKQIAIVFQKSMNSLSPSTVPISPTHPRAKFTAALLSFSRWSTCRSGFIICILTSFPAA